MHTSNDNTQTIIQDSTIDIHSILHTIKHYLPSQKTLKDFIHHNSLHPFQKEKFYDGIFRASEIFGYKVTLQLHDYRELFRLGRIKEHVIDRVIINRKGIDNLKPWVENVLLKEYDENINANLGLLRSDWKRVYKLDMDSLVHPNLYRILNSYLDQGISLWEFPETSKGFLDDMREVEKTSRVSLFRNTKVRSLFIDSSISLHDLLNKLVGEEQYLEQYLYDTAFSHRGWSGMVSVIEDNSDALLIRRSIELEQMLHLELCMELDIMMSEYGDTWKPLAITAQKPPLNILHTYPKKELHEVLKIWQDAFEWSYYDEVMSAIVMNTKKEPSLPHSPRFQAVFCIDERECSLRRHLEYVEPDCETLGAPGFFGIEFYFKAHQAKFIEKLCPAPVMPSYLIKEIDVEHNENNDIMLQKQSFTLWNGVLSTMRLGIYSLWKLLQIVLFPHPVLSMADAFQYSGKTSSLTVFHDDASSKEDGLQIGFTYQESAQRLYNFFHGIGLISNFSDVVYMVSHGSSMVNNPHAGAYDCGACSGRPGGVNARVFCIMANKSEVREILRSKGIDIPDTTVFIPCLHNTTNDNIEYYDDHSLSEDYHNIHESIKSIFQQALSLNAKERSRRFASIDTKQDIERVKKEIEKRAFSMFEPRPELGHGTNSLAIIGRRAITRGLYLDRRAFLNSYDYKTDPDGRYLTSVMAPIGIVCGGINLEYYFSRVDNQKLGCGTKLPHNVMGLLGVANSYDGDLRTGLPWQMIEPHDPVRLLVIVEHYPEIVLECIRSSEAMYEWYNNEWVHIAALHPETGEFFYFADGQFHHHHAEPLEFPSINNVHEIFEHAPEMISNHITHATFENLPIYQITNTKQ